MTDPRRVVVVAPTKEVARQAVASFEGTGHCILVMTDPASALREITVRPPDLLITEVRLGAFNGLHLAIHASASSTRVIVIGNGDRGLAAEACQHADVYFPELSVSLAETARRLVGGGRLSDVMRESDLMTSGDSGPDGAEWTSASASAIH